MAIIEIKVISAGNQVGNTASFTVAGKAVNMASGRGLNVVVIDQITGQILNTYTYDTSGSPQQSETFARMVEDLPIGRVVAIAVADDASRQLSDRARFACQMLGSAFITTLGYQNSWGMIGQKGATVGSALEQLDPIHKVDLVGEQPLASPEQLVYRVRLWSAGFSVGNAFWIEVNGERLTFAGVTRGLNVAVFDALSCHLVSQHTFDTYASAQAAQQFIDLVNSLPEGQFVAVAVQDEAASRLNEQAKEAFELLGSSLIRQLQFRNSYVLFGQKNADPGSAAESLSSSMPVFGESWIFPRPRLWQGFSVSTLCATPATNAICQSYVDGIAVGSLSPQKSGLLVTVIDEQTGIKLQSAAFDPQHDTSASASLAQLLHSVSMGRIVVISSMMGAASFLQQQALQACTLVGSGQIFNAHLDSSACWCVIGRKGAAPGSVAECFGRCGTALQFWFSSLTSTKRFYADLCLVSAGFEAGNKASIMINGHELSQWSRGMNVAVFDEQIATLLTTATFDTYASPTAADEFASLLEGLPPGRIVAIAVMDEASVSLTERARLACESIGSASIRQLATRGSWGIVGVKGAAIGSVAEALGSRTQTSQLSFQLFTKAAMAQPGVTVRCHSAGFTVGNTAFITVNEQKVAMQYSRGLNVVVIDPQSGQVTHTQTFDTYQSATEADAFAALIEGLPFGMLVAVAVMDEASVSLTERARRACRMIGSESIDQLGTRNSWAIVGFKGTAPGSVSEMLNASGATEVLIWLPLSTGGQKRFIGQVLLFVAIFAIVLTSYLVEALPDPSPVPGMSSALPPSAPQTTPARRWAVFVAIDYTQFPDYPLGLGLKGLPSDILKTVRTKMENSGILVQGSSKFLEENAVDPKLRPSRANVIAAIKGLVSSPYLGEEDVLYFHYLGHGNRDTTAPGSPQVIITLTDDLKNRQVFYDYELEALLKQVPPRVNLTFVFHCCFGGGMIDGSAQGRGIAFGAVNETTPSDLSSKSRNMSASIATRIELAYGKPRYVDTDVLPTYQEMLDYIAASWPVDKPILNDNQGLYDVNKMLFLQPFSLSIEGLAYIQGIGDVIFGSNQFVGTRGQSRMLEGFRIQLHPRIPGLSLSYMAHMQNLGDLAWVEEGTYIGTRTTSGEPLRLEGFAIKLTGPLKKNYTVKYMAHLQGTGDTAYFADGAFCGTRGQSRRVEGMQIIVKANF